MALLLMFLSQRVTMIKIFIFMVAIAGINSCGERRGGKLTKNIVDYFHLIFELFRLVSFPNIFGAHIL